jgi:hypothetical protein
MMFPLVLDLAADRIPVAVTCRVLGFSKQASYRWKAAPVSQRDWDDAHLINAALDIHHDDPEFGYRFIADELPARGFTAGRNRDSRLCTQQRFYCIAQRGDVRSPGDRRFVGRDLVLAALGPSLRAGGLRAADGARSGRSDPRLARRR